MQGLEKKCIRDRYGVPVTLESNVKQLHQERVGEADYEPSETVKTISNSIVQKTGYSN